MEKNKKIELFLGFLIIITIIGILYNDYIEQIKKEGFLPASISFTMYWDNLMFFVRTVPFVVMMLMIIIAMFSISKILTLFYDGVKLVATVEM